MYASRTSCLTEALEENSRAEPAPLHLGKATAGALATGLRREIGILGGKLGETNKRVKMVRNERSVEVREFRRKEETVSATGSTLERYHSSSACDGMRELPH